MLKKIKISFFLTVAGLTLSYGTIDQPNVVVFLVDDMGLMDTSVPFFMDANGHPERHPLNDFYRTPSMERLAEQGTRFSDFYAHTVCSPTRVSIMTGQNSARHGTTNWINPDRKNGGRYSPSDWNWEGLGSGDVTIPALLRKAGYRTIFVGKGHFAPHGIGAADPLNLGFDVNVGGSAFGQPKSYYGRDHYGNHPRYLKTKNGITHNVPHLEAYYEDDVFLTEALTLEAKSEIDEALQTNQPFFLYLSHYAVHLPFNSDPRFADHYTDSGKTRGAQAFATLVEGVDKSLGDLMDHLEARVIAEDTLILFLGDNGSDAPIAGMDEMGSSEPLLGKKGSRYEGGVRVPFLAAWAKPSPDNKWQQKFPIVSGAIRSEIGTCFDLFPTILDLASVSVPESQPVDGQSLAGLLGGKADAVRRNEFLSYFPHPRGRSGPFTAFRMGDWKVIYSYNTDQPDHPGEYELFNLKEDPSESRNLANESRETLKRLMTVMSNRMASMGALYPEVGGKPLHPRIPE